MSKRKIRRQNKKKTNKKLDNNLFNLLPNA